MMFKFRSDRIFGATVLAAVLISLLLTAPMSVFAKSKKTQAEPTKPAAAPRPAGRYHQTGLARSSQYPAHSLRQLFRGTED